MRPTESNTIQERPSGCRSISFRTTDDEAASFTKRFPLRLSRTPTGFIKLRPRFIPGYRGSGIPCRIIPLMVQPLDQGARAPCQFQTGTLGVDARADQDLRRKCGVFGPVLLHQLEIALIASSGDYDSLTGEMKSGAGSFVRTFDAGYAAPLSCQPGNPRVPVEGNSSRLEALPIDRFDQSIAAPWILMETRGGIAGGQAETARIERQARSSNRRCRAAIGLRTCGPRLNLDPRQSGGSPDRRDRESPVIPAFAATAFRSSPARLRRLRRARQRRKPSRRPLLLRRRAQLREPWSNRAIPAPTITTSGRV